MDNRKKGTRRFAVIAMIVAALMVASLSIFPVSVGAQTPDSHTPPDGYTPTPTQEHLGSGTTFLLIQDVYPWDLNSDELALIEKGDTYDVVNSGTLATLDLSEYKCILYASDQPRSYYVNIAANIGKIESWVANGGFLIGHVADEGWAGGNWTGLHILPGNVGHQTAYLDDLTIVEPTHCKVDNLGPDYFDGWSFSAHGWLTNLPPNAITVIEEAETGDNNPTYIDYYYGWGEVEATMQPAEWGYGDPPAVINYCNAGPREEFLRNELQCCQIYQRPPGVPSISQWGAIGMTIVLAGLIIWKLRRRRVSLEA